MFKIRGKALLLYVECLISLNKLAHKLFLFNFNQLFTRYSPWKF